MRSWSKSALILGDTLKVNVSVAVHYGCRRAENFPCSQIAGKAQAFLARLRFQFLQYAFRVRLLVANFESSLCVIETNFGLLARKHVVYVMYVDYGLSRPRTLLQKSSRVVLFYVLRTAWRTRSPECHYFHRVHIWTSVILAVVA